MFPMFDGINYLFDGVVDFSHFWYRTITYLIIGLFVGFFGWSKMEAKYKKALLERPIQRAWADSQEPLRSKQPQSSASKPLY